MSALDTELAEIDENLVRNELTVLERAEHLKRRKEIYEAKYPEAKYNSSERMKAVRHGEIISSCQPSFATNTAAKLGVSPRTVRQEVQLRAPRMPRGEKKVLTPEELEKLLKAAEGYKHYPVIRLLAVTGARLGEVLGLSWKDVDFKHGTVTIRR